VPVFRYQTIVSKLNGGCLRVENGAGATVAKCDASDPFQRWAIKAVSDDVVGGATKVTIATPEHDDAQCLSGSLSAALELRDWHGFDSEDELHDTAEMLFPSSHLSPGYKDAYTVSAEYMRRLDLRNTLRANARSEPADDQCPKGWGAPQGSFYKRVQYSCCHYLVY
jgi:hypothetical protein